MIANATPPSRRVMPPNAVSPNLRPASPALASIRAGPRPEASAAFRQFTRSLVGQRLRINGVVLCIYYGIARSTRYANATAYLVRWIPQLDSPLHYLGQSL